MREPFTFALATAINAQTLVSKQLRFASGVDRTERACIAIGAEWRMKFQTLAL